MSTGRRLRLQSPGPCLEDAGGGRAAACAAALGVGLPFQQSVPVPADGARVAGVAAGRLAAEVADVYRTGTAWAVLCPLLSAGRHPKSLPGPRSTSMFTSIAVWLARDRSNAEDGPYAEASR